MKMTKIFFVTLISFVFIFCICAVEYCPAQVDTGKEGGERVYRLDKVIVRDHPLKDESMVVTPNVTIINVDKFKKAAVVQNIQDVLSEALGLNVLRTSVTPSQSETVYVRGLDQSRYQIFVDGRPMRLFGARGYYKIDWTTMPLNNVETIEVIRGSHSLLYPWSMGGAINIITKKGKKTDEIKPDMSVTTEFGSYGAQSYSANALGGLFNKIGFSLAAAHREGDGYLRGNYYDTDSANARFTLYLPNGGHLSYGWDYVDTNTGYPLVNDPDRADFDPDYPVVTTEVDSFTHDRQGKTYPGGENLWDKITIEEGILLEQPLGPGEVRAQLYQHRSKRVWYYVDENGNQKVTGPNEERNQGVALDYLDFELIKNHAFSIGGDYRTMGRPDNPDTVEIFSGYFQDVWSINNPLTLTFGARYYHFEVDAYRPNPRGWNDAYGYRRKEKEWCPKVKLDYELDSTLTLYAAVSREMRMP